MGGYLHLYPAGQLTSAARKASDKDDAAAEVVSSGYVIVRRLYEGRGR